MNRITLLFSTVLLAAFTASAQVTAIRAGRIVDPETGKVATNQVILVEGANIKEIGPNLTISAGAQVIDLSSQTVMPGMFDAHTHLCMNMVHKRDANGYFFTTLLDSTAKRAIQGAVNAASMLEYGFTTIRDVGNEGNYACSEVRKMIQQGEIPGPTMFNSGRIIAPYGAQFQMQPDKPDLGNPEYIYADTRDELKKAIRLNIHYGANVIKLVVDDQDYIYSVDDIKFAIDEAHAAGVKLAAHCWTSAGALNAAKAGVDSIEHAVAITDEALAIAKKNNVAIVPIPFTSIDAKMGGGGADDNKESNAKGFIDPVQRAHKAGVALVWGPDIIFNNKEYPRGKLSIDTIDEWKMTNLPNLVILQSLTTNAAKLLGVEKTRGSLKPGMRADIIAVKDNPLEKIETVKSVTFVMKNGKVFKRQ